MHAIAITDIHDHTECLRPLLDTLEPHRPDLLLVAGDITHLRGIAAAERTLEALHAETGIPVFFVPGNCDRTPLGYQAVNAVNLHNHIHRMNGWALIGLGGSLPCPGRTPNELSEADFHNLLSDLESRLPADHRLLFLCHQPPHNTCLDRVCDGSHVGSLAVRAFIERVQPEICITGHIHESAGTETIGRTRLFNPGPFAGGGFVHGNDTNWHLRHVRTDAGS